MELRQIAYTEGGEKRQSRKLYAVFADRHGIIRKLPLFTDRKNSAEAAR